MRKIIDDRGRLFGLISVIDVIVAAVVIVLAIAVLTKFRTGESPQTTTNTDNVTYTVKISGIRKSNVDLLRHGDKLYAKDTGLNVGTIMDIKVEDAYAVEPIIDGTYAKAKVYERYDVTLTVNAPCSQSNGRYYVDRTFELNVNADWLMYTKYNEFNCTIMTIEAG
ncbi:MAG: DUF4330 domain-containing protein [Oscillospiraceae bacterium]|jgi:hypothetical protein|nr:DUF4330 domain-containing protein [Oscillospiraceae bacterium]